MALIGGVDWDDAPEPVQLEAGEYEVRVVSAKLTQNKKVEDDGTQGHHVAVTFAIQNADDPDFNGKEVIHRFSTKRTARFMFLRFLNACGLTAEGLDDYDDLAGHECKVQVVLRQLPKRDGDTEPRMWPEIQRFIPLA